MLFVVYMKEKTTGRKITTGVFLMRGDAMDFFFNASSTTEIYTYHMEEVEAWDSWSAISKKIT